LKNNQCDEDRHTPFVVVLTSDIFKRAYYDGVMVKRQKENCQLQLGAQ
jgi:uncharacterized circularly permuted ATP-grasp superfamily protein